MSSFNNKLIVPFCRNFSSYSNRSFFRRSNYDNQNYSYIPIYKYIDVKIDSKFEEIIGLLNDMKKDNQNFQNNVIKDFQNFQSNMKKDFHNFEEKINSRMMAKAIGAGSAAFVICGGFIAFLGSTGVKIDPPKMYLEEKKQK